MKTIKIIFIVFLLYLTYKFKDQQFFSLLHYVDLNFHEAGHFIFLLFGEFVSYLGGGMMQTLVPIIFGLYFYFHKQIVSALLMLWWVGENLVDVGRYMADARAQVLPLLGGSGNHDWAYLFGRMGLLNKDIVIGNSVSYLGFMVMYLALVYMMFKVLKKTPKAVS